MPQFQEQGQLIQADYFDNKGGLNNSDSPFSVPDTQAVDGRNYEYTKTGGIRKRFGQLKINSAANAQLKTMSIGLRETADGVTRDTIRAAGTKIQNVNIGAATFTDLTEDTTSVNSDFLAAGTTTPVANVGFNTASASALWLAGGGMSGIYGVVSSTKVTANGVAAPTGAITVPVSAGGGSFASTGNYAYTIAYRKLSTQALSNVALDQVATLTATTEKVTLSLTGLTNLDTAKFDKIYIYRSGVGGGVGFTTGDLIAQLDSTTTSYVDTGTSISSSNLIPRSGNLLLDNTVPPLAPASALAIFKQRLVTAKDSTVYMTELNKPESWPIINEIVLPTGGPITGIGVISFTTPTSTSIDEILAIFKKDELWVITGTGTISGGIVDWSLKKIDTTGCTSHNSIVAANGYLYWWNERGIFLWDGSGKPIYISRPIENYFSNDGAINKAKLNLVWGEFFSRQNEVVWYASHKIFGEQKFALKLDLRLTLPQVSGGMGERVMDAVFIPDTVPSALYDGTVLQPLAEAADSFIVGDDAGFLFRAFQGHSDATAGIPFEYETNFLNQGQRGTKKQYYKVIAWVEDLGDWNVTLDWWTDYRISDVDKDTRSVAIGAAPDPGIGLWDVGQWDVANWDDAAIKLKRIEFNLSSSKSNTFGDAIKLKFSQSGADEPLTIHGYSILYTSVGYQPKS